MKKQIIVHLFKCRIFSVFIFVLLLFSCIPIAKLATGFKNPEVLDLNGIIKEKNKTFLLDETIDLVYKEAKDSAEIVRILSESFNGQINIYNTKGERLCFKEKLTCTSYQLSELQNSGSEIIGNCPKIDLDDELSNLSTILEKLTDYDLERNFEIENFANYDYIFIYYWSSFIASDKSMKSEYDYVKKSLDSTNLKYIILRINCDLREDWGLKKGEKQKILFEKKGKRKYELAFGNIPWKN